MLSKAPDIAFAGKHFSMPASCGRLPVQTAVNVTTRSVVTAMYTCRSIRSTGIKQDTGETGKRKEDATKSSKTGE